MEWTIGLSKTHGELDGEKMAMAELRGGLVILITVVQRTLLLHQLFVPKTAHVKQTWVTVKPMTCASQDPVDQITVLQLKPVLNVLLTHQILIVVKV